MNTVTRSTTSIYWQRHFSSWLMAVLLCLLSLVTLYQFGYTRAMQRLKVATEQDVNHQLELQVQILESHLEKYRILPVLMGRHGDKTSWLDSAKHTDSAQLWLRQLNYLSGSFDTLILDTNGAIIASAQDQYRRLYNSSELKALTIAPKEGRLGRQYLTLNGDHTLYGFSSYIQSDDQPFGILVFMVNLEPVLQSWAIAPVKLVATDRNKKIVMASDASLMGSQDMSSKQATQQSNIVTSHVALNTLGWTVTANATINNLAVLKLTTLTAIFLTSVIISIFTLLIKRKEKIIISQEKDLLHAQELELKISMRTTELREANALLTQEVNERRIAEEQLKTKQQELIQSAKLAAIGQMSTTLSHEYNQPLATMRTYAENGIKFLTLNKIENATDNLNRIIQQTDRLGNLSRILMSFARKPSDQSTHINIHSCVEESFMLVRPRLKKISIQLSHNIPESAVAFGNSVQISQVILNLLTNAIDAIYELNNNDHSHQIRVNYQQHTEFVTLSVDDSGPGISDYNSKHIFEPFFTSKKSGAGLGLGLPIVKDIIKEHDGNVILSKSQLGGACFTFTLPNEKNN